MEKEFVAINYIDCTPEYKERFEQLFKTRSGAIDEMDGFIDMQVLKPRKENEDYLIVSRWKHEDFFINWLKSDAFIKGHQRGFADVKEAEEKGVEPPMKSKFKTYEVIAD